VAPVTSTGAADAAGGPGHQHRSCCRVGAGPFQPLQGQGGGEAGRADLHGFALAQPLRDADQPIGVDPNLLAIAAVVVLAEAIAGYQYCLALCETSIVRMEDAAGDVDARHQRKPAHHATGAGDGHGVFVIDAGIAGLNDDIASGEVIQLDRLQPGRYLIGVLVYA
jgi:hypothetical protein